MTSGLLAAAAALALAAAFGLWRRQADGRPRAGGARLSADVITKDDLGVPLGGRATLLQFSSEHCSPCRASARILMDVAQTTDGVSHVEIDAEDRLDLVRRLNVRRTPTTFVLGPDGRVTHRVNGQPVKAEVVAALAPVIASLQQ